MFEPTTSHLTRDAIDRAHVQRGQALREALSWMIAFRSSR